MSASPLTNPQSLNMYSYVGNDPVNFVDPTGLLRVCYYSLWGYRIDVPGYPGGLQPLYRLDFCIDYPDEPRRREPPEPGGRRRQFQHPQKPAPKPTKLTPEQKKEVWQKTFEECMNRKELERQAKVRAAEHEASRHMTIACVVGGVVGAIEGGIHFGPLGVPLGFHFGCVLGASEAMVIPILAIPDRAALDKEKSRREAEKDCKKEADRVVSRL